MSDVSPASAARIDASAHPRTRRFPWSLDRLRTSAPGLDIVLASGVALVLGLIRLGAPSVWVDESFTARAVRATSLSPLEQYHWLYLSIVKPWTLLAGTSEWALRMPSVIGAMLACGLLVAVGRRLFDRWVALIAGLLLATNPFVVKWSQQARGYTLLLAASLLATLLLLRALERGSRGSWAAYGIAFSVVFAWHSVAALVVVPAHLLLARQRRGRVLPHGLVATAIVVAVGVPCVFIVARQSIGKGVAVDWLQRPTPWVATHAVLDISGAAGLGLFLAVFGLWILWRLGHGDVAAFLGAWAFLPFVLALLVSIMKPVFLDRYLIVAAPGFALLAAVALRQAARYLQPILVLAMVIATSLGLAQWYSSGERGNWRAEDWRGAVGTVLQNRSKGDAIVVVPWSAYPAATYYGARVASVSTASSIWVLSWSDKGDTTLSKSERRLRGFGEHRLVERLQFGRRLSVQHWER